MSALKPTTAYRVLVVLFLSILTGCAVPQVQQGSADGPGLASMVATGSAEQPRDLPKSRIGNPPVYEVFGKQYRVMDSSKGYREQGIASWYGSKFHGRKTSSGEVYNMYNMTAAHTSLPLPTFVSVRNLDNDQSVIVKVNDRGPFHAGRIIDLSYAAATKLGILETGTANVEVTALSTHLPAQAEMPLQTTAASQRATPSASPTIQPQSQAAAQAAPRIIQVGAFSRVANAESMRRRVDQAMQINAAYILSEQGDDLHRVRFGVAAKTSLAEVFAQLEHYGIDNYRIISD